MKKLFFFLISLLSLGLFFSSCSSDKVNEVQPATRSYETDAELLTKFVDVN